MLRMRRAKFYSSSFGPAGRFDCPSACLDCRGSLRASVFSHQGVCVKMDAICAHPIRGGNKHMGHLRSTMACIQSARSRRPALSACRRDEVNEIHKFPQVRRGATRYRVGKLSGCAKGLVGARAIASGSGEMRLWAALRRSLLWKCVAMAACCAFAGPASAKNGEYSDPSADDASHHYWEAVERNEAEAIKRRALRKRHMRRLQD